MLPKDLKLKFHRNVCVQFILFLTSTNQWLKVSGNDCFLVYTNSNLYLIINLPSSFTHKLLVLKYLNFFIDLNSSTWSFGTWAISRSLNLFSYWTNVPPWKYWFICNQEYSVKKFRSIYNFKRYTLTFQANKIWFICSKNC